jgi:hypothetical protein
MKKYLTVTSIAVLSWLFSLLVRDAYGMESWQCLVNLAVVDFVFMSVFCYSISDNDKVRWICSLLTISVSITGLSSIVVFLYSNSMITENHFLFVKMEAFYPLMSMSISALILGVAMMPSGLMDRLDGLCWPNFARAFRYRFDLWRNKNSVKGAF